jgi:predicted TIM-barrel fold metal-dependent hydrolase
MIDSSCDCHVHVFGPRDRYPQRADRAYTAGIATVDALRASAEPLGITRFVIVQASVNGTDNSCLLDTLDVLDGNGRGVVVVDPQTVAAPTLDDWHRRGVRGLRINLYSDYKAGDHRHDRGPEKAALRERLDALIDIAPPGWHIEVIAPMPMLAGAAPFLAESRVPIVIDHYGLPVRLKPDATPGALLDLLRQPHMWMKLSAPYRAVEQCGGNPHETTPPDAWLKTFIEIAPERLVWGSDWPHSPPHDDSRHGDESDPFRPIDYGKMFGEFLLAAGPSARGILSENPARLYGFEDRQA